MFLGEKNIDEVLSFLGKSGNLVKFKREDGTRVSELQIYTLEDGERQDCRHIASEGDIIIRGVSGECWPVKPEVFKQTYKIVCMVRE